MKIVDILPENLGVVIYPEHDKLKSLVIDEINNHGNEYEHKKRDSACLLYTSPSPRD